MTSYRTDAKYLTGIVDPINPGTADQHPVNLLGLADTETVYDASNTIVAQTTYGYDNYAGGKPLLSRGTVIGNEYPSSFEDRGNQTSVSRLVKRLSGSGPGNKPNIVTYKEFDTLGNVHRVTDGRAKQTGFIFDTSLYAFVKQVNRPTVGGVTLTTKYGYDTELGLPTSIEEPNGMKTVVEYNDLLMRITNIRRGPGALPLTCPADCPRSTASFIYNDDPGNISVKTTADQFTAGDGRLKSETLYDRLGREIRLCRGNYCSGSGAAATVIAKTYDGLNRVQSVSNPGLGAPGPATTTVYDSLNRPRFVCHPTLTDCDEMQYQGQITIAIDPALKKRELRADSLGRLVKVIEAPGTLSYNTDYTYDGLDNLTGVTQGSLSRAFNYDSLKRLLDATNPESGKIDYDYDENGNLNTVTQARKIPTTTTRFVATNTYDDLNRPIAKSYNDGGVTPTVNYCYDGKVFSGACSGGGTLFGYGQVSGVGNVNGSTNYTYDDQGRVQISTQRIDTTERQLAYQYYADNSQAVMTIPGPKNRVSCYDVQGRAIWVSGQLTTTDCINGTVATAANSYGWVSSFAPHGAVQELNFGATSSLKERWCYNARLQTSGMRLGTASTGNCVYQTGDVFGLRFEYTSGSQAQNNGNLMQQFIQMRKSATDSTEIRFRQDYGYDAVNRIASAQEFVESGTGAGWQRGWTYDPVGNLAMNSSSDTPPAGTPTLLAQYEQTTNRLKYFKSTMQSADVMNYDDGGNLIDRPANIGSSRTTYDYDAENRLRKVDGGATQENFYDGLGRRVKRIAGSTTVTYVYGVGGELVLEYGSPVSAGGVQFLTVDHLGSTRVTTRPDGSVVSRMDFEPFGVEAATTSRVAEGYAGDPALRQRFTGKERDPGTKLDFFGARYYSAPQGRFSSPDQPFVDQFATDPKSWNLYGYARNNPLRFADPSGQACVYIGPEGGDASDPNNYTTIGTEHGTCADAFSNDVPLNQNAQQILGTVYTTSKGPADFLTRRLLDFFAFFGGVEFVHGPTVPEPIGGISQGRTPQDVRIGGTAPRPAKQTGKIGTSPAQARQLEADIAAAEAKGATDIRVDQYQTNAQGQVVGQNRPDLQYTVNNRRYYVEYERSANGRGFDHAQRIKANDPSAIIEVKIIP